MPYGTKSQRLKELGRTQPATGVDQEKTRGAAGSSDMLLWVLPIACLLLAAIAFWRAFRQREVWPTLITLQHIDWNPAVEPNHLITAIWSTWF